MPENWRIGLTKIVTYDEVDPFAVYRLTASAFGRGLTESHVRRERRDDPRCFEGYAFYAIDDGKPVAQTIPFRMRVRLATGVETIGAISAVCSHPAKWGRGFARATMVRAHEWFQSEGIRVAALTSSRNIRGFAIYQKMGYVSLGPFYRAFRTLPKPRGRPSGIRSRRATTKDFDLIQRLFRTYTADLLGWTLRDVRDFRAKMSWGHRLLAPIRIVLRNEKPVGYFRTRPADDVLIEEAILPKIDDFRATVALLESRTRSKVAAANWITAGKDQDRFQALGYELEGPDQDVTMALSLDGRLKPGEILDAFGVPAGTFAHYPSDDF